MNRKLFSFALISLSIINSIAAQNMDSIRIKLETIITENASIRDHVMPTVKRFGFGSSQMDSLDVQINLQDSIHLSYVTGIIEKHGWLGISKIGSKANRALFLTIQHSDLERLSKYFPLLLKSAKNGESNMIDMATMKDRILIQQGMPQIYGTQWKFDNNEPILQPFDDPKKVNKRRKELGLEELNIEGFSSSK